MALESFGTKTASEIDKAASLCHDLLKCHRVERVNQIFKASDPPNWWVEAGYLTDTEYPVVVIKLGVG